MCAPFFSIAIYTVPDELEYSRAMGWCATVVRGPGRHAVYAGTSLLRSFKDWPMYLQRWLVQILIAALMGRSGAAAA